METEKDTTPRPMHVEQSSRPEDPHQELKTQLAVFLLSLIQAFLRTGYYTPDHPESQKAKAGLYDAFQGLFTRRDELTFLVRENSQKAKSVLIEGVLPEPQPLKAMMLEGMAEMYTPRFVKFLERKDLVSLTLKNAMTESEFISFVDLMSEPRFVDTQEEGDKERFRQELHKRGIFNISYIFNEELLATKRKIPWRARLALTRLRKDVSTIPLFLKLGAEELRKIKSEIIRDIIPPIREPVVVYPILMNSDLAVTKEFSETEIDQSMVASLSAPLLLGTSEQLLKAADGAPASDGKGTEKAPEVAQLLAHHLNVQDVEGRKPILERLFQHELIPIEELPLDIRYTARLAQLTDKFLHHTDTALENLNAIEEPESYRKAARSIAALVPELLRRNTYEPILQIIQGIGERASRGGAAAGLAGDLLDEITDNEIGATFKTRFLTAGKEHRDALAPILVRLHHRFLPHLIAILKESDDAPVRR